LEVVKKHIEEFQVDIELKRAEEKYISPNTIKIAAAIICISALLASIYSIYINTNGKS